MFGTERAAERARRRGDAQPVIDHLLGALDGFTDPEPSRRTTSRWWPARATGLRPAPSTVSADFRVRQPAGQRARRDARVAEAVGDALPAGRLERLKTATAEATMNAMEHGNRYDPELFVHVMVRRPPMS